MQVPLFTAEGLLRNHGRWIHCFCRLNIQAPAGFSLFKCIWACGTHECQRHKFDSTIAFSCWWLSSSTVVKVTSPQLKRNTLHQCSVCAGYKSVCLSCYLLLVAVFFSMNLAWVVKLYAKCHQGWTAWTIKKKEKNWSLLLIFILIDWSKEALIEAWMADPVSACKNAGVTLPDSKSLTSK